MDYQRGGTSQEEGGGDWPVTKVSRVVEKQETLFTEVPSSYVSVFNKEYVSLSIVIFGRVSTNSHGFLLHFYCTYPVYGIT